MCLPMVSRILNSLESLKACLTASINLCKKNLLSQENQQIIYKQTEGIRKNRGLNENLFSCIQLFRAVMGLAI